MTTVGVLEKIRALLDDHDHRKIYPGWTSYELLRETIPVLERTLALEKVADAADEFLELPASDPHPADKHQRRVKALFVAFEELRKA